ncbi:Hypothetical protein HVR_LOCUS207 [uncultured virus]|nr:Hypothetical protein HVR_LOCUS207 [uncultured virus]
MGNISITPTPFSHSKDTIKSYLGGFDENLFKVVGPNELPVFMKQKFAIYLEDHIVNNVEFNKFDDKEKEKSLAMILFMFAALTFDNINRLSEEQTPYTDVVCAIFGEGYPSKLLSSFLGMSYRYDDDWYVCDEKRSWVKTDKLSLGDYITKFGLDVKISNLGLDCQLFNNAVAAMKEFLISVKNEAEIFIDSDAYKETVESIKSHPVPFNRTSNIIPCHSFAVHINKCKIQDYDFLDFFTIRLNYDINLHESPIIVEYLKHLDVEKIDLGNFIIRCGYGMKNTLTVVSGPEKSGKSTLLKVIRAMYGPYASTSDEFVPENKIVRVCFMDNYDPKNREDEIKNHKCDHLVVVSNSKLDEESFAGRRVHNLVISSSINEKDRKETIFTNLNTQKQFGHLLGWAFKNYDFSFFGKLSCDNPLYTLMGGWCNDNKCKKCGNNKIEDLLNLFDTISEVKDNHSVTEVGTSDD